MNESEDTTQILLDAARGSKTAVDRLLPLVYQELHAAAAREMRAERHKLTLQATALVNEAYLRLIAQSRIDWKGRAHFFALAAEVIRRVLVDHARRRAAAKRGGGLARVALDDVRNGEAHSDTTLDLIALDEALAELAGLNSRQARIVELKYFGGLTDLEVSESLRISETTAKADWRLARAWLGRRLGSAHKS